MVTLVVRREVMMMRQQVVVVHCGLGLVMLLVKVMVSAVFFFWGLLATLLDVMTVVAMVVEVGG